MTQKTVNTLNTVNGKSGYADLTKCRTAFSAFTIASLIALGLLNMSAKGLLTKGRRKYNAGALRAVTNATMVKHWTTKGRLDESGLTVAGINECARRVDDPKYGYRTNREAVVAMLAGITTGGEVKVDGHTFDLRQQAAKLANTKPSNPELNKGLFED